MAGGRLLLGQLSLGGVAATTNRAVMISGNSASGQSRLAGLLNYL